MIQKSMRAAAFSTLLLLGGCIFTQHQHFDLRKGVEVPLPDGVYSCSKERSREESGPPGFSLRSLLHPTTFRGRIEVQKISSAPGARYLFTEEKDPTAGTLYAFHRVAGDVFAYGTVIVPTDKNADGAVGNAVWFVRITDKTITPLHVEDQDKARAMAAKYKLNGEGKQYSAELLAFSISGPKEDERRFLDELAGSNLLKPVGMCSKVDVPATK